MKKWGVLFLLCSVPYLFSCRVAEKETSKAEETSANDKAHDNREKKSNDNKPDSSSEHRVSPKSEASIVQSEGTTKLEPKENLSGKSVSKKVRFSFRDVPVGCREGAYLVLEDGSHVKIESLIGLLSPTVSLPTGQIIEMYDKAPVNGVPQGNKILTTTIPDSLGEKVISIIVPLKDGKYDLVFIDRNKLESGTFYLHNLTDERLGMQIDQNKIVSLGKGEREFVVLGFDKGENNLHPARLFRKDDKGKWFVTRQFALLGRPEVTDIILFIWNEGLNKPDVVKIAVTDEPSLPAR